MTQLLVGARTDAWRRKPLLMVALMVLPLRGLLYTVSDNSAWLVAVQLGHDLDDAHHPFVLMIDSMRVVDETPDDHRIGKPCCGLCGWLLQFVRKWL